MNGPSKIVDFASAVKAGREDGEQMLAAVRQGVAGPVARWCPGCSQGFAIGGDDANRIAVLGQCFQCAQGLPPAA